MDSKDNHLSAEDCQLILHNSLKGNNSKVSSYTVKTLSDKVEGLLGEHFLVTIEFAEEDGILKSQQYFMKVLNRSSKLIFEMSQNLNAYKKEEFFYNFLLKEFNKYDIDTSFTTRCYFSKPHLLVLEDLSQKQFMGISDKSSFLDVDHCKVGLRTLAKLHSASLLYEVAMSTEQKTPYSLNESYPELFQDALLVQDNGLIRQWLEKSIEAVFALIPIVAENHHISKIEFTNRLQSVLKDIENLPEYSSKFCGTVLHGDLWYNNFMFKYVDDKVTESVLIDYQLLKYGPPSTDVLHFIYANTRKNLRDSHFDELLDFYFNALKTNFGEHDLELLLPKHQFSQLCRDLKFVLKLFIICDRSVTLLVDDIDETAFSDENLKINLFQKRTERVLCTFKDNAFFREVITEDMLELYNLLIDAEKCSFI